MTNVSGSRISPLLPSPRRAYATDMVFSAHTPGVVTSEQFLDHPAASGGSELVRGVVRMMTPASGVHGVVSCNVLRVLSTYVREHRLGRCFADSTGFALPGLPNTVRAPDASFVRAERLPHDGVGGGWVELAPDLAVEVLSPTETASDVSEKLADYRAAGTALVWVVDPAKRTVGSFAQSAPARWLNESDTLDGDAVLPGFRCAVIDLFEGIARSQ
jgi:Uma2 family endonuclease